MHVSFVLAESDDVGLTHVLGEQFLPSSTGVEAHVGGVVVTMVLVSLPAFTTSGWTSSLPGDLLLARYSMALSSSLRNGVASSSFMIGSVGIRSCCIAESVFLGVKLPIVWTPSLNLLSSICDDVPEANFRNATLVIHGPKAFFLAITHGTDITDVSRKFDALAKL